MEIDNDSDREESLIESVEELFYKFMIDLGVSIIFISAFMKAFNFWQ